MKTAACAYGTDVGRERDHNEDNLAVCADQGLWVVADGMGGHEAGEVASAIAVAVIPELIKSGSKLSSALERAHRAIIDAGNAGKGSPGMGCTAVALKLSGCNYQVAWVGDSRAYLWNGSALRQLTSDHSFVQQMIDAGALTEEEARVHPQRSVITQALGVGDRSVQVDTLGGTLLKGESILLCSDGLTSEVEDIQIANLLSSAPDLQQRVQGLITAANDNGGSDNITVILIDAPQGAGAFVPRGGTVPFNAAALNQAIAKKQRRALPWIWVAVLALFVIVGFFFFGSAPPEPKVSGGGGTISPATVPAVQVRKTEDEKTQLATQKITETSQPELTATVDEVSRQVPVNEEPIAESLPQIGNNQGSSTVSVEEILKNEPDTTE